MSNFIKFYFEQKQILKGVQTEIISPSLCNLQSPKHKNSDFFMEETNKFINKYKDKQVEDALQRDKISKIRDYKNIKSRLLKYSKTSNTSLIQKTNKASKNSPFASVEENVDKVYLLKKYNVALAVKLQALYEAQKIQQQKQSSRKWTNNTSMNPLNSPNFKKMNFLIQKIHEKPIQEQSSQFRPYRRQKNNKITASTKPLTSYGGFSTTKLKLW